MQSIKLNVMENNAAAFAKCLAVHFADVALIIGGQHAYDLLEEDHKYHTSIAPVTKKYHDVALISTVKQLCKQMCLMLLKILIKEKGWVRTFARKFSNIDFFLKILPLKDDGLAMSEM